ncbi:MAG TPA: hypothetical protein EYQ50_21630 [Verrucomicrobiales bacterium]|nr:hypothetical protein [Verrucomicrobiales bacterium]
MVLHKHRLVWLFVIVCISLVFFMNSGGADTKDDSSLHAFIRRNPFNLQKPPPPPPPPPPPEVEEEEPGELFITGISTLLNPSRAYLMSTKNDTNVFFSLAIGELLHGVSLLNIGEDNRSVVVKTLGKKQTLSFRNNSRSLAKPKSKSKSKASSKSSSSKNSKSSRSVRSRPSSSKGKVTIPGAKNTSAYRSVNSGLRNVRSRSGIALPGAGVGSRSTLRRGGQRSYKVDVRGTGGDQPPMTQIQSEALMEIKRSAGLQKVPGFDVPMPPLPPTQFTPQDPQ